MTVGNPRKKFSIDDLLGQAHAPLRKKAKQRATELRKRSAQRIARRRQQQRELEVFIIEHWHRELDLYEATMLGALDLGRHVANQRADQAVRAKKKTLFSVLVTLHARACLVASEVLTLIRSGHGAGAYGRWRTLHEASVVASFLLRYGEDAAVRFFEHAKIEDLKTLRILRQHGSSDPGASDTEIARREQHKQDLLTKFGKEFGNDYGWAVPFVKAARPRWRDIETHANISHAQLHYRAASSMVHSNSVGTLLSLRSVDGELIAVNTPSDDGLATPGFASLIPLLLITSNLVSCTNNSEDRARLYGLGKLGHEAIDAFLSRM